MSEHIHEPSCATSPDRARPATMVDPRQRARTLARLRRIEGQIRGLHRMIEEGRDCAAILTQLSSAQEALRAVGRELLRHHLKHCASSAIRSGGPGADAMCDQLVDLMYRHVR